MEKFRSKVHATCRESCGAGGGAVVCPDCPECQRGFNLTETPGGAQALELLRTKDIREKNPAVWDYDGMDVYLRCPSCTVLNAVDAPDVSYDGFFGYEEGGNEYDDEFSCVTCRHCGIHFYAYLKGWKSRNKKSKGRAK